MFEELLVKYLEDMLNVFLIFVFKLQTMDNILDPMAIALQRALWRELMNVDTDSSEQELDSTTTCIFKQK
jgi:hypothetical protein